MQLTDLPQVERDALHLLLEGESPTLIALRAQLRHLASVTRSPDAVGVYIDFHLDSRAIPLPGAQDFELSDVVADSPGAEPVGFILFIRGGLVSLLEGYVAGDRYPHEEGRAFSVRRDPGETS
ncbi:hypothetical protein [Noviluteimonas dokdonensis]|uniref:hypothetical protein n=1 Tax=Noviluteimonas dokdonensis TaxID=414050 RepID=UPI000560B733|nr:hypothetical protein [Lysobacter dokdonensis]